MMFWGRNPRSSSEEGPCDFSEVSNKGKVRQEKEFSEWSRSRGSPSEGSLCDFSMVSDKGKGRQEMEFSEFSPVKKVFRENIISEICP